MKPFVVAATIFLCLTAGKLWSAEPTKTEDHFPVQPSFPTIFRLMTEEKYTEALAVLDTYPTDDNCHMPWGEDVPSCNGGTQTKALRAQCLWKLGRAEEARLLLRSIFETTDEIAKGAYGRGLAAPLLIELATAHDPKEFDEWLQRFDCDIRDYHYLRTSIRQLAEARNGIENGQYENGYKMLRSVEPDMYNPGSPDLGWQQKSVFEYFKKKPESIQFLLDQLSHKNGNLFLLGELANPLAIPPLRALLAKETNSNGKEQLVIALSKCGDRSMIPELYQRRRTPGLKRLMNSLLIRLTGVSFGEIKEEDDANAYAIFDKWKAWIEANYKPETIEEKGENGKAVAE